MRRKIEVRLKDRNRITSDPTRVSYDMVVNGLSVDLCVEVIPHLKEGPVYELFRLFQFFFVYLLDGDDPLIPITAVGIHFYPLLAIDGNQFVFIESELAIRATHSLPFGTGLNPALNEWSQKQRSLLMVQMEDPILIRSENIDFFVENKYRINCRFIAQTFELVGGRGLSLC